jgi:hypothetical protein
MGLIPMGNHHTSHWNTQTNGKEIMVRSAYDETGKNTEELNPGEIS